MTDIPEESRVIYQSKDGKHEEVFDAPLWLAANPHAWLVLDRWGLTCQAIEPKYVWASNGDGNAGRYVPMCLTRAGRW